MSDQNKVFISYRRSVSQDRARLIFRELRERGYDVFLDVTTIDSGAFDRIILNQIAARPHFLLILSPGSLERCVNEGDWLRREIEEAFRLRRNIVPVFDEHFDVLKEKLYLPEPLRSELPRLNAPPYSHYYFDAFIETICTRFPKPPVYDIPITATPPAEQAEVQRRIQQVAQITENPLGSGDIQQVHTSSDDDDSSASTPDYPLKADGTPDFDNMAPDEIMSWMESLAKRPDVTVSDLETEANDDEPGNDDESSTSPSDYLLKADGTPDFDNMSPDEIMAWMESLAKRQGVSEPHDIYEEPDNPVKTPTERQVISAAEVGAIIGDPFEWCEVPAGEFLYGKDKGKLSLSAFAIAKYPITNNQFQVFIDDQDGFHDPRWWDGLTKPGSISSPIPQEADFPEEADDLPRESSWDDAVAFCRWLSFRLGAGYDISGVASWAVRLPTEFEWEKAARGTDGRIYPWGNRFDIEKANTNESRLKQATPVTAYPQGASPYGVLDMSGNVGEWCLTDYDYAKVNASKENLGYFGPGSYHALSRVVRGGSSFKNQDSAQTSARGSDSSFSHYGFRIMTTFPVK